MNDRSTAVIPQNHARAAMQKACTHPRATSSNYTLFRRIECDACGKTWEVDRLDMDPATQASLHTAYHAWTTGKAYIDGRGNYHVREDRSKGPIAPWNKTVKRLYASVGLFHIAAREWASTPQSQPTGATL